LQQSDIVVMDEITSHKVKGVKATLRKAAERTFDALVEAIGHALDEFIPQERANYLANSGYRHQP
jgi:hypothetical protein